MKLPMNHNPPNWDYTPAPVEESVAHARETLALLFHQQFKNASDGACDDCGKDGRRVRFGQVVVCDSCAWHRWKASEKAA